MQYLPDISYNNIDKGIEYLQKNKFNFNLDKEEITIFHVYWYGNLDRKQILCINSYLKTQDLEKTKLWIWLDYNTFTDENIDLIPKHNNIEIKKYIPDNEAKGTLFENNHHINQKKYLKFRSDLARIIFLYKYGGLYYDLDMILLKDFQCLLGIEFCYMWANLDYGNNGILRMKKKSEISIQLMKKYNSILKKKKFNINFNQLIFTNDINLMCFPSVMFDPCWILTDTKTKSKYSKLCNFDDFFKKTDEDIKTFFDNQIFSYHWHSRNDYIIEKNSYFEKIENYFIENNIND